VSESLRVVTDDNGLVSAMDSNHAYLGGIESYVCVGSSSEGLNISDLELYWLVPSSSLLVCNCYGLM